MWANIYPVKVGMILNIDPERCTGCLACEVYCSLAHEGIVRPLLSRIQIFHDTERQVIIPITCIPCEEKPCLAACPEPGALSISSSGTVLIEESLCTGCSRCVRACQIGAIRMHRLPGRGKKGLAVAIKCDQCDGDPWCVRVCPAAAITISDSNLGGQESYETLAISLKHIRPADVDTRRKETRHE
jgi:Fe-S-cluster-containing hydrogenase component 2